MPRPSRTCAFGASSKAAYYSLSPCYLKTFWQPWKEVPFLSKMVYKWKIKGLALKTEPSAQGIHYNYAVWGLGWELNFLAASDGWYYFTKILSKVEKRENKSTLLLHVFNALNLNLNNLRLMWNFALTS